ncbi:MAG TPA: ATP-dependent zinc metalloprotease FtsH [Acidimicrobiales bacterium]|nr:ATP-dependent zinc metalloprotease FtsH [Acidimicrobiales bacterium]
MSDRIRRFRHWWAEAQKRRRRRGWKLPFDLKSSRTRMIAMLLLMLVVLAGVFSWSLGSLSPVTTGRQVGLSDVVRQAGAGNVAQVTMHDVDHRMTGSFRTGGAFWATYPSSDAATPALIDKLVGGGAQVQLDNQRNKRDILFFATYVLPLVMLANLFALIFVGTKGGDALGGLSTFATIGKGRGNDNGSGVTFADVAGADYAVIELREVRDYLADPERFAALGALPPKGIMMFGPPGCGKTLMARAVAGEAEVPFFSVSGAEFVESLVGVGAARVRDLFRQVRSIAPAIVFIDEIDAVGRRRGGVSGGQDEREQTLNQLLIEMDGFDPTAGVVVVGATNRPDILDPALLRPGRFDRQITVEPPDFDGRVDILKLYAERRPLEPGIDYENLARRSPGFTGADLANVVNEAALLCVRQEKPAVGMAEMEEAVDRVISGPKRRGHLMTDEERRRIAYHEAAHVLVAASKGRLADVPRVSIVAHGHTLGHTAARTWGERTLITRAELQAEMSALLAGMAAEELVFGEPSTGSEADLERATGIAQMMAGRYGMSDAVGKVPLLHSEGSGFLGAEMVPYEVVGPAELSALHAETSRLVDQADGEARDVLTRNRAVLEALTGQLLEHESLEGDKLLAILAQVDARRPRKRAAATYNGG